MMTPAFTLSVPVPRHLHPRPHLHRTHRTHCRHRPHLRPTFPSVPTSTSLSLSASPHRPRHLHADIEFSLSHIEAAHFLSLQPLALAPSSSSSSSSSSSICHHDSHSHSHPHLVWVKGPHYVNVSRTVLPYIPLSEHGVHSPTSKLLVATWPELTKLSKRRRPGVFHVYADGQTSPTRVAVERYGTAASLVAVDVHDAPPTLLLNGFTMHRIARGVHPGADTASKLASLHSPPPSGHVLDTCTGLGYTAIALADQPGVSSVVTVERSDVVVEMQHANPWSEHLFINEKISRVVQDVNVFINSVDDHHFNIIVHDPPSFNLSPELYAQPFYNELARVCSDRLFHYVGDVNSKESGRLYKGIVQRLQVAGFRKLRIVHNALGLVAYK